MNLRQRTISRQITLDGAGLFSGEPASMTILPAEPDSGVTFLREQGDYTARIPALVQNVLHRPRRTCLRNGSLHVEMIEHCMAALSGMGISNAIVRVSGGSAGELPSIDGSSAPIVQAITSVGLSDQDVPIEPLVIHKPLQVVHGEASIAALPGPTDHLEIIYDFEAAPPIGRQVFAFSLGQEDFAAQVAPARTFVFEAEARELRAHGVGQHLTPKDLLVLSEQGPIENEFRFPNECARHKVLDIIGDLYLAGRPIYGRIVAHKSGHELNHMLVRRLLEQKQTFDRAELLKRDAALDIRRIQRILPHRYPMLLVDRVLEIIPDQKAVGIKNVTFNDVFFQGHYPGTPIMPGVLIVEALAQLGGILLSQKLEHTGKLAMMLSMDKVKMRHPVVPGDQLILEALVVRVKSRTGHVRCKAFVGEKLAVEADIKFMLVDAEPV
jgi:UDP-3-O-[3-hydroxymyristoyl] N-acetylglucosamine deacetylase/3-hydroxyacyl-[acyl-carrier-protein] dehydratase